MKLDDLTLDELPSEPSDEPLPQASTVRRYAQRWGGAHYAMGRKPGTPTPKPFEPPWSKDRSLLPRKPPGR